MTVAGAVLGLTAGAGALLVVIFAGMTVASARAARNHLVTGIALAAPSAVAAVEPKAALGPNALGIRSGDSSDTAGSQRIVAQLNQYYAANISQGSAIFWASLLSMSIGFAVVFAGILTAQGNATTTIVAGVAGILSQFIAATFLVALRSTQQQSTTYAQMLTGLRVRDMRAAADAQAVALGLELLRDIAGDGALADQTRAALAMGLIVKPAVPADTTPVAPPPVDGDEPQRTGDRSARLRAGAVKFDTAATVERSANAEPRV